MNAFLAAVVVMRKQMVVMGTVTAMTVLTHSVKSMTENAVVAKVKTDAVVIATVVWQVVTKLVVVVKTKTLFVLKTMPTLALVTNSMVQVTENVVRVTAKTNTVAIAAVMRQTAERLSVVTEMRLAS